MKPRVSVIIPTYNREHFISQAVESVLSQAYRLYEIIVVDDGSTDDTRQVLVPYHDRIRYVYQENEGVSAARNRGMNMAQAEYVVFLDADDYFLPEKLEKQVSCLDADSSLGMVHSGWRLVNKQGETIGEVEPWHTAPRLNLKSWLLWKPVFPGAVMFRTAWLRNVGGFDTGLRQAEDVDLILRLALKGCKAAWIHQPTVCYRQHESNTMRNCLQQVESLNAVMANFFTWPDVPSRIRRLEKDVRYYTLMWSAWQLHLAGLYEELVRYLQASLEYVEPPFEYAVLKWMKLFAQRTIDDARGIEELRALRPYFGEAAPLDDVTWTQTERVLSWWVDIWWLYLDAQYARAAEALPSYRGMTSREFIRLAQAGLIINPLPVSSKAIDHLWQDAMELGLVHASQVTEITALYLTAFGQAVLSGQWSTALTALLWAVRKGCHFKAMPAWYRFSRAALFFFITGRPERGLL